MSALLGEGVPPAGRALFLGVSVRIVLEEINIRISRASKEDPSPQGGRASERGKKAEEGWNRSHCSRDGT